MDRYLPTSLKQKNDDRFSKLGRVVAIVGPPGTGKTWAVHQSLGQCIEITPEILKCRQDTVDFLEKIRTSPLPVVLDEYESVQDLIGLREIKGPPTHGVFVVTSHVIPRFDFEFVIHEFPVPTEENLRKLFPESPEWVIREARGDIRWVVQNMNFKSDFRDDFQGPKSFVSSLVVKESKTRPAEFIGAPITEPGNIASILNANYLDGSGDTVSITESFSIADMIETSIYKGDWSLMHYYNVFGCIIPSIEIGHTLEPPLKPGSSWTKYQNMCMRQKKIRAMSRRIPGKEMTLEELLLLREYAEHEDVKPLQEYGLTAPDMDVLNHMNPYRKLKPKTLSTIKKCLLK